MTLYVMKKSEKNVIQFRH